MEREITIVGQFSEEEVNKMLFLLSEFFYDYDIKAVVTALNEEVNNEKTSD